jgi:hypothetical protein
LGSARFWGQSFIFNYCRKLRRIAW